MKAVLNVLLAMLVLGIAQVSVVHAQNPNFPGYLGVYVVESTGGMQITGFIRDTPAAALAEFGDISSGHTIVRLGGRATRTLGELHAARNRIPLDKEAKMILRDRRGDYYYVWISRSPAVAAAQARGAAPMRGAPDEFRKGGRGTGGEEDFRDRTDQPPMEREEEIRDKR